MLIMSNTMIKAENISKNYRIGVLGSRTVQEDIRNWWNRKFFLENDPAFQFHQPLKNQIRALKNINFDITHGEVMGFIGRNGAGKSTLLKIISKITLPTTGKIFGKGRTASLLEVGTGFHGDLTGRENIFLNGHIMGMRKKEIERKFDEIVNFSGVERFIDTPVKRYSSGMYVRLAFAVAAHLEPEILIIDEVLAVGDAEFQQKCINKIREVSSQKGKTILFVSHNMQAIRNLCHRAIELKQGEIANMGDPETVIAHYLKTEKKEYLQQNFNDKESAPGNQFIRIKKVELIPQYLNDQLRIDVRTPLRINFEFWNNAEDSGELKVGVHLFNLNGDCIFDINSPKSIFKKGLIEAHCEIPGNFLNDGSYYISILFTRNTTEKIFYFESCLSFDVEDYRETGGWYEKWIGSVRPDFPVVLRRIKD